MRGVIYFKQFCFCQIANGDLGDFFFFLLLLLLLLFFPSPHLPFAELKASSSDSLDSSVSVSAVPDKIKYIHRKHRKIN